MKLLRMTLQLTSLNNKFKTFYFLTTQRRSFFRTRCLISDSLTDWPSEAYQSLLRLWAQDTFNFPTWNRETSDLFTGWQSLAGPSEKRGISQLEKLRPRERKSLAKAAWASGSNLINAGTDGVHQTTPRGSSH